SLSTESSIGLGIGICTRDRDQEGSLGRVAREGGSGSSLDAVLDQNQVRVPVQVRVPGISTFHHHPLWPFCRHRLSPLTDFGRRPRQYRHPWAPLLCLYHPSRPLDRPLASL